MKKNGPTIKTKVLIDNVVVAEDVSITLPEISLQTAELPAMGSMDVPIPLTDAIEATINSIGFDKGFFKALGIKKTQFECRWVENELSNDGTFSKKVCRAYISGATKSIPGGEVSPGNSWQGNLSVSVMRYRLIVDGVETVLIDKLNNICKLGDTDYMKEVNDLI